MENFSGSLFPLWGEWFPAGDLGQGSVGEVLRIRRDLPAGPEYAALKQITISADTGNFRYARAQGMDAACIRYFFRSVLDETMQEIGMMRQLSGCPNIVRLEDSLIRDLSCTAQFSPSSFTPSEALLPAGFPEADGWLVLIRMELLTPFIDRMADQPMAPSEICRFGIHLCQALEACEQAGIVHRDVKPENIFWQERSDTYKLGDFGFAHYLQRPTEEKGRAGTLTHMSPEIYAGAPADHAGDLYALGIILYRLLNDNRIPFLPPYPAPFTPRERDHALLRRLRGETPPLPSAADCARDPSCTQTRLGVPFPETQRPLLAGLARIARKAVNADPAARFRSAGEMKAALREAAEDICG